MLKPYFWHKHLEEEIKSDLVTETEFCHLRNVNISTSKEKLRDKQKTSLSRRDIIICIVLVFYVENIITFPLFQWIVSLFNYILHLFV